MFWRFCQNIVAHVNMKMHTLPKYMDMKKVYLINQKASCM